MTDREGHAYLRFVGLAVESRGYRLAEEHTFCEECAHTNRWAEWRVAGGPVIDDALVSGDFVVRADARFWPGPLMMVLPARVEFSIWVTHGSKTLGVRVPDHQVARELARLCGGSIVSTSANRSGEEPFRTAGEAAETLGKEVDLVLDAGEAPGGLPSTVIDLSGESAWILRKGPITGSQILEALSG